jgi:hypothetical protein
MGPSADKGRRRSFFLPLYSLPEAGHSARECTSKDRAHQQRDWCEQYQWHGSNDTSCFKPRWAACHCQWQCGRALPVAASLQCRANVGSRRITAGSSRRPTSAVPWPPPWGAKHGAGHCSRLIILKPACRSVGGSLRFGCQWPPPPRRPCASRCRAVSTAVFGPCWAARGGAGSGLKPDWPRAPADEFGAPPGPVPGPPRQNREPASGPILGRHRGMPARPAVMFKFPAAPASLLS